MADQTVDLTQRDAAPINSPAIRRSAHRLETKQLTSVVLVHLVALTALMPWLFSWTGVVLCVAGIYVFGTLGINIGFHRLLTHRGFTCPRWFEYTLAIIGTCSLQDAPARWVAIHRRHHQFSDDDNDPHSPRAGFFWAHMGWVFQESGDMSRKRITKQYAKDLIRQPFYAWLERDLNWALVTLASWMLFFVAGFGAVMLSGGAWMEAVQFGLSLLVWGAALRTVIVWHITWSVNSVTHLWGYRNYNTPDLSRNNTVIGLLAAGEGWHNNHHADPRSARHGHRWWEFDISWLIIRALMGVGLAKDVAMPSQILAAKYDSAPRPPAS